MANPGRRKRQPVASSSKKVALHQQRLDRAPKRAAVDTESGDDNANGSSDASSDDNEDLDDDEHEMHAGKPAKPVTSVKKSTRRHHVRWLGEGKQQKTTGRIVYPEVQIGDEVFGKGDDVYMKNLNDADSPYLGHINSLYETKEGTKMLTVQWYHRPVDTHLTKQELEKLSKRELFKSDNIDENPVEAIESKVTVLEYDEYLQEKDKLDSDDEDVFFFRKFYDDMRRKFIDWHDDEGLKKVLSPVKKPTTPVKTKKRKTEPKDLDLVVPDEEEVSDDDDEEEDDDIEPRSSPQKRRARAPRKPRTVPMQAARASGVTRGRRRVNPDLFALPARVVDRMVPKSTLEMVRASLHVSAVPASLPCRENEFDTIYNHIANKLKDNVGGCIYISGVPGTGKTATVHEVIRSLQSNQDIPFQYIEINCMKLTEPQQAYSQLWHAITDQRVTPVHAAELLEKQFSTPSPRRLAYLVLLDELDLLVTKKQSVLYNFFDWPHQKHARLICVAIANTMDLPERVMLARVQSRLGPTRLSFAPYTFSQLQTIIMSRLGEHNVFGKDAIPICARKIAAVSGDARRALDVCRRAAELAEAEVAEDAPEGHCHSVEVCHIMAAFQEMSSSPAVMAMKHASLHERILLCVIVREFERSGIEESTFGKLYKCHIYACGQLGVSPPTAGQLQGACMRLGASRILLVDPTSQDILQRIRINGIISMDDIKFAMSDDDNLRKLLG